MPISVTLISDCIAQPQVGSALSPSLTAFAVFPGKESKEKRVLGACSLLGSGGVKLQPPTWPSGSLISLTSGSGFLLGVTDRTTLQRKPLGYSRFFSFMLPHCSFIYSFRIKSIMLTICHVSPVLRDRKEIEDEFLLFKHL